MSKNKNRFLGNLIIFFLFSISCIVWYNVYKTYSESETNTLIVTFLDVKQGDSIFIKTPNKKYILIDGGSIPKEWSTFDAGKLVVVPYLKNNGIKKIDYVIATHPDLDHIGGLVSVLKNIEVDTFIDSGTISTTKTYETLLNIIDEKKIKYTIAQRDRINIDSALNIEILSPINKRFLNDANNNSIVIKIKYDNISFLLCADIGKEAETEYVKTYGETLKSDILKVAHHGGKSSTSDIFLNYVQPRIAVISVGKHNAFGHPSEDTLSALKAINADIYRTDQSGAITIKTDGKQYSVLTQK